MAKQRIYTHWITASGREGSSGSPDLLFPYWSFTKTAIAICALKLVEQGILDLNASLSNQPYSLRHLLAHTSGLPDYGQVKQYHAAVAAGDPPWSREKLLDIALADDLLFQPDQGWSYSNIGYLFICEKIEQATDQKMADVISELIVQPLGLSSVTLAQSREQFARLHWDAASDYDPGWVYHGCLTGNAQDAAQLLHALFSGNLLAPGSLSQMTAPRPLGGALAGRPWTQCAYALGLMTGTMTDAGTTSGHSGCGPFSVNAIYHFTETTDPLTVACFTDGNDEGVAEFATVDCFTQQNHL